MHSSRPNVELSPVARAHGAGGAATLLSTSMHQCTATQPHLQCACCAVMHGHKPTWGQMAVDSGAAAKPARMARLCGICAAEESAGRLFGSSGAAAAGWLPIPQVAEPSAAGADRRVPLSSCGCVESAVCRASARPQQSEAAKRPSVLDAHRWRFCRRRSSRVSGCAGAQRRCGSAVCLKLHRQSGALAAELLPNCSIAAVR